MVTNDNITGNRMRLLRIERRMTQEEVGQHLGVSKATINKYELGTTQNLSRAKIQALATLFEVSPAYLMGWTNARDGSDLFTTYPPDQIFPQDVRISYPGLRPDDSAPKPEAHADRLEAELVRIFHELSVRNQTKLLSMAYDLQDSERALTRETLTTSTPLPTAEELSAFIDQMTSESGPAPAISEQEQKRVDEIIERAKERIRKHEVEKEKK